MDGREINQKFNVLAKEIRDQAAHSTDFWGRSRHHRRTKRKRDRKANRKLLRPRYKSRITVAAKKKPQAKKELDLSILQRARRSIAEDSEKESLRGRGKKGACPLRSRGKKQIAASGVRRTKG